jgi:hypothetical protein
MTLKTDKNGNNGGKGLVSRYAVVGMTVSSTKIDGWASIEPALISALVKYLSAAGDAVLFSQTHSGGLSVTIYSQGEPVKIVSNDVDDMTNKLIEALKIAKAGIPDSVLKRMDEAKE